MDDTPIQDEAVELLLELGLKEYEAKAFVALSRLPQGTAKDISEISDVPRTRVYDAIRVLETQGLVEVRHSNPQQFRAVSIDEAIGTLQTEYENRTESLRQALSGLEPADREEIDATHEIWALSGDAAITSRTQQLVDEADRELVLVIGHDPILTDDLVDHLRQAEQGGVSVLIGAVSEDLREQVTDALPGAEVFVSGLDWLTQSALEGDDTEISRLLLIDRETILVSTYQHSPDGKRVHEQAVFGRGFDNGIVAIVRRIMATGLLPAETSGEHELLTEADPGDPDSH